MWWTLWSLIIFKNAHETTDGGFLLLSEVRLVRMISRSIRRCYLYTSISDAFSMSLRVRPWLCLRYMQLAGTVYDALDGTNTAQREGEARNLPYKVILSRVCVRLQALNYPASLARNRYICPTRVKWACNPRTVLTVYSVNSRSFTERRRGIRPLRATY